MKHFRSKIDLVSQEIGAMNVNPYPLQADEVDIEANIPIGKRNVNNMAILLAIDNYDDINFTKQNFQEEMEKYLGYMQNLLEWMITNYIHQNHGKWKMVLKK